MELGNTLKEYVQACFTGLWVHTHEPDEAILEISRLCREENWRLAQWDIQQGLVMPGNSTDGKIAVGDPLAAIMSLAAIAQDDSTTLLVLRNLHRLMGGLEVIQALERQVQLGKTSRAIVVILAPTVDVPLELEKLFVVMDHPLPGREQLRSIAQSLIGDAKPDGFEQVVDSAAGLTRYEAEGAFSLSLVRDGTMRAETIWELKEQLLRKTGLLQMHRGCEGFGSLGGLEALKSFCKRAIESRHPRARPRGVLTVGVPGSGKSAFAKSLGFETRRPTIILDVGAQMGSLVGQTEQNIRRALATVDALAPCVLMVDEVEKALAGVASSGQTDSGVSARLFGTFLTWLNDHTSDVFVVTTCNDISKLPVEFSRAERFDGVFFVDLPSAVEKARIWEIAGREFELDVSAKPKDENWTGAEIHTCCRLAALLDIPLREAAKQIVPIATMAEGAIDKLRQWASGRCLDASQPGVYQLPNTSGLASRRRLKTVGHGPSAN